jgi:hypothetical protein
MARFTTAPTNPGMPVVRPGAHPLRRRYALINLPAAVVIAASVLVLLFVARLVPSTGRSITGTAASLNAAPLSFTLPNRGRVTRYALAPKFTATSAIASTGWLVFSTQDPDRHYAVMAENRRTRQVRSLLPVARPTAVSVRALTDRWAVMIAGSGTRRDSWQVLAQRLDSSARPLTLVDSRAETVDTPVTLSGIWAQGDTVLVAGSTESGTGVLFRIDLSANHPRTGVIARTAQGHLLTDPSEDHGTYYWDDLWYDSATGLHGTIWAGDGAGHAQQISPDDTAFRPSVAQGMLVWVEIPRAALAAQTTSLSGALPDSGQTLLNKLSGTLDARDLTNGQQWQISPAAQVTSVERHEHLVLWHDSRQTHAYDIRSRHVPLLESQVRDARMVSPEGGSVVWDTSSSPWLYVYDAA